MRSTWTSTRRVWLLVNVLVTLALLPALFTESEPAPVTVAAGPLDTVPVSARSAAVPATTTTTAPPAPVAPPTTAAPAPPTTAAPKPKPVATAAPKPKPTTTTTAAPRPKPAPTTTAPPAPPAASGTESGKASWYDHQPGVCAHKTLPMGTVVTISYRGRSTTCTVGDRGPFIEGWIIDLHPEQFEQLAPRSTGVIAVTISW